MPIKRKIFSIGNSRAITLPKSWLELLEQEHNQNIESVSIEVNGALIIKPLLKEAHK